MKPIILGLVLATTLPSPAAHAQTASPIGRDAAAPSYAASQRVIDAYRGRSVPPAATIEQLYAKGLEPTAPNIAAVRAWLGGTGSADHKVALVRLLGSLYAEQVPAPLKLAIARDVRTQIQSGDRRVALAAVQTFARLGYQTALLSVLDEARARALITDDDYAQEVALALPLAPRDAQAVLAQKLVAKDNAFGAQVLASTLTSPEEVGKIAPQAAAGLRDYLQGREPVLPVALGQFGLGDGGRYAEWLHTLALLEQSSGKRPYAEAVWARLNDERTDPRNLLGFLTAPEGKAFIQSQGRSASFTRPAQRAAAYARQFPGHPVMSPLTQSLEHALAPAPASSDGLNRRD
jgi:hypothetical protein